jgi:hypothetical protein
MTSSAYGVAQWARIFKGKVQEQIRISNAKWDKQEVRRGDTMKLTADVKGIPDGNEAQIEILEYDANGAHKLIKKFPARVRNKKIEAEWAFEYREDTDDIQTHEESEKGYNPPEYFFRITAKDETAESGLLKFRDWIEIKLLDESGKPVAGAEYVVILADGTEIQGKLDNKGYALVKNVPPGPYWVKFPEHEDYV